MLPAKTGNEALVGQCIEQGAKVDWRGGQYNSTALHETTYGGHTPVVIRLLDAGWSLDARDKLGNTPLILAANGGRLETAECLLLRKEGNSRSITPTNIGWILRVGWMFYLGSLILNLVYYKLHPTSPKMCNWRKEEQLEEWSPPRETQTQEEEGELEARKHQLYID